MRKLCIGGCNFGNRSKTSALAVLISAVAVTTASTAIVRADTVLGQFTLTNYYTPTSPTDPTPTDPSNPLSATVTFTYLNPSANGGNNLAVTIDNTSTPYSSNELIRDVVFQVSDNGSLLTGTPGNPSPYLATSAYEYDEAGTQSLVPPGGTLSYPWTIGTSSAYLNSYELSSTQKNGANLDMVAPPIASLAGADYTVAQGNLAPVLTPASGDSITFDVSISNLDNSSTVQSVFLGYGFKSDLGGYVPLGGYVAMQSDAVVTPEPSIGLFATGGLIGAGLLARRRRS